MPELNTLMLKLLGSTKAFTIASDSAKYQNVTHSNAVSLKGHLKRMNTHKGEQLYHFQMFPV